MEGKRLLFVTYHDDNLEESLSYAVELAKTMNNGIEVLLIYRRRVMEKFDDMMTAVAFSEEGEHKTARELISNDYRNNGQDYEKKMKKLKDLCLRSGVKVDVSYASMDPVSAIKNILRQNLRVDMVILSPCITNNGGVNTKVLNKLAKTVLRPVVKMERQTNIALAW